MSDTISTVQPVRKSIRIFLDTGLQRHFVPLRKPEIFNAPTEAQRPPEDLLDAMSSTGGTVFGVFSNLLSAAATIFLINVIAIGLVKFFINLRENKSDLGAMFFGFSGGNYLNIVLVSFLKSLFIGLWTLLFIVPGIIKGYAYFMVDYLVAENPGIDYKRALEISENTMKGEKWFLFVLRLSFIGWWCLVFLTCGVGSIFLTPYIKSTEAEFYAYLKAKALSSGTADISDFGDSSAIPETVVGEV